MINQSKSSKANSKGVELSQSEVALLHPLRKVINQSKSSKANSKWVELSQSEVRKSVNQLKLEFCVKFRLSNKEPRFKLNLSINSGDISLAL